MGPSTQGGTISVDTNNTDDTTDDEFIYTPPAGFTGSDSFEYTITDATGDADTGEVNITVSAPNTITAVNDTFDVLVNSSNTTLDITANDIGVRNTDGSPLVTVTQIRINGVASTALGQIIAVPNGIVEHTNGANGGYLGVNDDTC